MMKSCKAHRNTQRILGGIEILDQTLATISPTAQLPTKFAQSIVSLHSIFKPNTSAYEKTITSIQTTITLAQVGLLVTLILAPEMTWIFTALTVCDLLYQGILLSGWAIAETNKKEFVENATRYSEVV